MGDGSRCHGQRPSISSTRVQLRKARTRTRPASRPRLMKVNSCAMVFTMSAATSTSRPSNSERPIRIRLPQLAKGGPGDAGYDNENAEDLDPAPHHADGRVDGRLESLECVHIVHVCASDGSRDAAYSVLRRDGNRFVPYARKLLKTIGGWSSSRRFPPRPAPWPA